MTRGLNPATDSRVQDSNGDGTSDFDAFRRGIHPMARASQVPAAATTQVRVEFKGYVKGRDSHGNSVQTAQYGVTVDNVPLIGTDEIKKGSELYYSRIKSPATLIPSSMLVGSMPHAKAMNEILLVGKVQALQDPTKSYFIFSKKSVKATGQPVTLKVNFSEFRQLPGK